MLGGELFGVSCVIICEVLLFKVVVMPSHFIFAFFLVLRGLASAGLFVMENLTRSVCILWGIVS